jgi:hypothetical protein
MKVIKAISLLAILLLPLPLSAADEYVMPQGPSPSLATLSGSQAESAAKKPVNVFILGVDGRKVKGEARGWNSPVYVAPGKHMIALGIGDLLYEEFEVDLCAGCSFMARATHSEESKGMVKLTKTQLWISKEPDSLAVTEKKPGKPRPRNVKFMVAR